MSTLASSGQSFSRSRARRRRRPSAYRPPQYASCHRPVAEPAAVPRIDGSARTPASRSRTASRKREGFVAPASPAGLAIRSHAAARLPWSHCSFGAVRWPPRRVASSSAIRSDSAGSQIGSKTAAIRANGTKWLMMAAVTRSESRVTGGQGRRWRPAQPVRPLPHLRTGWRRGRGNQQLETLVRAEAVRRAGHQAPRGPHTFVGFRGLFGFECTGQRA